MRLHLMAALAVFAIVSGCASPTTPVEFLFLSETRSGDQMKADVAACDSVAAGEVEEYGKLTGFHHDKSANKPALVLLGGVHAPDNISIREYVTGRPGVHHAWFRARCMRDKGYMVASPTMQEKSLLNAADSPAARNAIVRQIYLRR